MTTMRERERDDTNLDLGGEEEKWGRRRTRRVVDGGEGDDRGGVGGVLCCRVGGTSVR